MTGKRPNLWTQLVLSVVLIFAVIVITFIVFNEVRNDLRTSPVLVKEQRSEVTARAWIVSTYVSESGEAKEAFLLRVAPEVAAWTQKNQAEVCAFVATDGNLWGLKLLTLRSQFECVFSNGVAPEGMTTTAETFHSHPPADGGGYITLTQGTKAAALALGDPSLRRVRQMRVENGGEFSERDFDAGPGYLITNGRLLFQNGRGKKNRRDVGPAG